MQPIIDDLVCLTNWITFTQREVYSNTGLSPGTRKVSNKQPKPTCKRTRKRTNEVQSQQGRK